MPQNHSVSPARVVGVTSGLVASGAIVGAGLGAGLLGVLSVVVDGRGGFPHAWFAFVVAGVVGAGLGGIGLPVLAWSLLRDQPLIRVFTVTTAGTAIGASVGFLGTSLNPIGAMTGACAGFVGSALMIRARTSRRASDEVPVA